MVFLLSAWPGDVGEPEPPPSFPSLWSRDALTGDWGGLRKAWADRGFTVASSYAGEVFGNPGGGRRQGVVYDGLFSLSLDADVGKLTGWPAGGTVHANFFGLQGPGLSGRDVGDFSGISNIAGYNTFRLQECWYQQEFFRQRLAVKAGLIAADTEFFVSDTDLLFLNATFGTFPFVGINLPNPPVYPIAAPGVRILAQPTPDWYFQAGLFSGNPGGQDENKNGFDFRIRDGALLLCEAGYLLNQGPDARGPAGKYKLGAFVDTDAFDTWDSQAGNALAGGPLDGQGPDYGLYAVVDQQFFKHDARLLSAALRGGLAPSNVNATSAYFEAGLNAVGFVPGRSQDVAGIGLGRSWASASYGHFNESVNGAASATAETVIEATYRIALASWWTVQPDLQYIVSPGGTAAAHDAVVVGCRATIQF